MRAAAMLRGNVEWSTEEQRIRIGQYALTEGIGIINQTVLVEDKDLEKILEILSEIDSVIVIDETRISRDKLIVDEFKIQLAKNNVDLIVLNP